MPTAATPDLDREAYEFVQQTGLTITEAADQKGINRCTYSSRYHRHKARLEQDPAIGEAMEAVGTGMVPRLAWAKTKSEDGTSYSVLLKPAELPDDTLNRIRNAFEGMKPAPIIAAPDRTASNLCTVYPLMDVHYGMLAWGRESGVDYDLKSANADLRNAFAKVTAITPNSKEAVLLIGGDFFHADDTRAETPAHRHKLDVDGRHPKVLREGLEIVAAVIETLARKHETVTVRAIRGNHDEHSYLVLTYGLYGRYMKNERVTIDIDPKPVFQKQWGRSLIAAHHGDKIKPQQLAMYLADVCTFWSETRHRYVFTGHVHHESAREFGGLKWESLRAFAPADAYAAGMGYTPRRALQALTFDKQDGLVLRATDPVERAS